MKETNLSERQSWNQRAEGRIRAIGQDPDKFLLTTSPVNQTGINEHHLRVFDRVHRSLGSLAGKRILELGCGLGDFSVFLEKNGACVAGIDIGPDLVVAARLTATINGVACQFLQASMVDVPFESEFYDAVVGVAVLHHLSPSDLPKALGETHRVLRAGGIAVFSEPVENSKIFDMIQALFPADNASCRYHRPSILCRKEWAEYQANVEDRALSTRELISAGKQFRITTIEAYGLTIRAERLIGYNTRARVRQHLLNLDRALLKAFPMLRHFSQTVVIQYGK